MVNFANNIAMRFKKTLTFYHQYQVKIILTLALAIILFSYFKPQKMLDIWLTRDQQGQIWFYLDNYSKAANVFIDTQWQAYSFYGAEKFEASATLYSQLESLDNQVAFANALAHDRRYVNAKVVYQRVLEQQPDHQAAAKNLSVVQDIIDQVNLMSESQQPEQGDSPKELGDEPQTGDGAEKPNMVTTEVEQLSAEQLLLNPALNEMWLKQVQKNPALFLAVKFQMQLQQAATTPSNSKQQKNTKSSSPLTKTEGGKND